ncbi:hypothetical protein J4E85_009045 [Alternaria conjuncta]|uniref:uncharacterized protein n=1 Tax=Alternaria conjuncta TaxID=181017 RepID=UPI00222018DB|nr:uncharacterized protein J4E85_009045 [Alternaria conjuncta]KAI4920930.1 hypothetical protein J4E85_009045 [Alternaria conjuncta]
MASDGMSLQDNIQMLEEVLPAIDPADRPVYENMLQTLYQQRSVEQHQSESDAQVTAIIENGFQPNNAMTAYGQAFPNENGDWTHANGNNHTSYHSGPSYTNGSSYGMQVPPSPPLPEPQHSRKRSLGITDYPEAKRVSGQPSPVTPTSPVGPWSQSLPSREAARVRHSDPMDFVDLTESNPPSPGNFELPIHVHAQPDPAPHYMDPFPELNNYQGGSDNGTILPADAFNQEFMAPEELAEFLIAPSAPGSHFAVPQTFPYQPRAEADYPEHMRGWSSDGEEYGRFPLNVNEAEDIEKLLQSISAGVDEEDKEKRAPTPKTMTCTLKEYQRIGLTWLLNKERGATKGSILADDMGLGKTIQALALICANPPTDPACKTTLIIAPVALMRQWEKEIERHIHPRHKLKVHLYHGSGKNVDFARLRQCDVVLTTFGSLTSEYKQKESSKEAMANDAELRNPSMRRKAKDRLALLGQECMWYRIIIDEAHNIKNRNSKASKACADLMAKHRLCMTGTPMMNSVDELFPLLRFLKMSPYTTWTKYSMDIAKASTDDSDYWGYKSTQPRARTGAQNRLHIVIKGIMLRRRKDAVVDGQPVSKIPPKHSAIDSVEFEDEEHELYKALETKSQLQMNKFLDKGTVTSNYANVLVLLLRLRQACCHPHLIKDLSQPATEAIDEHDLLSRARELSDEVVARLKANESFDCPICLDLDPNPTILIPCGHTVCGECVQKIMDPAMRTAQDGNDEAAPALCPHCRGDISAKLITDYKHFCKVHCPERLGSADLSEQEEGDAVEDDSDSDISEDEEDAVDVDRKGNLAGFVVDDDEEDEYVADEAEDDDDDLGSASVSKSKKKSKSKAKAKKSGKGNKGKGKERAKPKLTLAQLKKESLRNKSAKKRYLRRLDKTFIPSAKISRTVELLKEIKENDPTEKTLVFSQFTSLLDLVEVPLHRERLAYQRYDGSMKMDERADAVNAFMDDPNENIMLVSLKAGNAGLNLWKASQVIILDPFWNPFIEEQAIDRAHRMPQEREVYVHRIIVPETVEDRIIAIQDRKREQIDAALDENASKSLTKLSVSELKFLFGMGGG